MAKPNRVSELAAEKGLSEIQFLQNLLLRHTDQKSIAAELNISQAAISEAFKRNGFVLKSEWVRPDDMAHELETA